MDTRLPLAFPFPEAPALAAAKPSAPAEYGRLRAAQPVARVVLPTGDRAWLVTRYDDVRAVLCDARFSRAAAELPGAPRMGNTSPGPRTLLGMDPPGHTRLRGLVAQAFTPRRVERLRPRVRELATELVARLASAGPPADLVAGFARAIPLTIIFELLGVPAADCAWLHDLTDVVFSLSAHSREEVARCRAELERYMSGLIAARRERPADDLLTALVTARDQDGKLSEEELISFGFILMTVGHESTAGQLASAILSLLLHPDDLGRLRRDPALVPSAVEELLRYNPYVLTGTQLRVAVADVEVSGVTIRAGDAVIAALPAANRDPAVFDAPDRLDLARGDNRHVAFGYGPHHCIGASLARLELQVALDTLLGGLRGLRLAVREADLQWKSGPAARRLVALPVTWNQ